MTDKQATWAALIERAIDMLYVDPTPAEFDTDDEYYYMSENMQGHNSNPR